MPTFNYGLQSEKPMKRALKVAALLLILPGMAAASPELSLSSFYDYVDGKRSTVLKKVSNTGSSTAFVNVAVAEIHYDEQGNAREEALQGGSSEARALVVTPSRLIIPAKGAQSVRLLYRGSRSTERYFRLRFIPVLPEADDSFGLNAKESADYKQTLAAGVNLLKGFGTIVLVQPADTRYATEVVDRAGAFSVRNKGNASVVLESFKDCDLKGAGCAPSSFHHVRPGQVADFAKAPGRVYTFTLREGSQRKPFEFTPSAS